MSKLITDVDVVDVRGDPATTDVTSIAFDSRAVEEGALFCCVPGAHTDGHDHASEAVSAGAVGLVCEHFLELPATQVRVGAGGVATAMAEVAASFFDHPARDLAVIGVTGTNGKTTVTQLVASVLGTAGVPTGVIGTLSGARTTPESPVLQQRLAVLRAEGRRAAALEVSSHALAQHRVDGMVFAVAAFTNLSREHLDYHRTMDEYFAAKSRLFEPDRARRAVVDVDDPWGQRLAEHLDADRVVTVSRSDASDVELALGRTSFTWRGRRVTLPLTGAFNIDNALVAAGIAGVLGVGDETVVAGLATARTVPGRMEPIEATSDVAVLVDYAHTPGGLELALSSARALTTGRLICLFGCGGDRDHGKRPEMGEVAARLADVVVLTSDNPRSEDPATIIREIEAGAGSGTHLVVEPDRARAIEVAVELAERGDVVLLAGKGHETTQTVGTRSLPFDDRVEARRALARAHGDHAR